MTYLVHISMETSFRLCICENLSHAECLATQLYMKVFNSSKLWHASWLLVATKHTFTSKILLKLISEQIFQSPFQMHLPRQLQLLELCLFCCRHSCVGKDFAVGT